MQFKNNYTAYSKISLFKTMNPISDISIHLNDLSNTLDTKYLLY